MERLTRRVIPTSYQCSRPADKFEGNELIRANQKLGKLEDIEEELGIPLEVLFKALKEGIYCLRKEEERNYIYFYENIKLLIYDGNWMLRVYDEDYDEPFVRYLKDYRKTWSLTKEELEDA